ncbi:MAG: AMP-binding protein [Gaiellaceae bacterium]
MHARAKGPNLASLLTDAARSDARRPALVAGGETVDYGELEARAARFAGLLRSHGVEAGDRVAILLPNAPAFVEAYFGALRLGAIVVPLNHLLKRGEIEHRLADSGARLLVAPPERGEGSVEHLDPCAAVDAPPAEELARVEPGDTAVILYTSGTTGGPKGAQLTHSGLRTVATTLGTLLGVRSDDVVFGAAPLAHVFGQSAAMNMTIAARASVALVERFDAAACLELIARERVQVFLGVPTMCMALLAAADGLDTVPSIRVAHCGGSPMPVEALRAFAERFDCNVLEGYGLSEAAGTVTSHRLGRPVKPGSVGEPIEGTEVAIPDVVDGLGEVLARGPGVMRAYWRNDAGTRAALSADGWLSTGDIGYLDDDGYLFLVDRKKDVIIRGGYNVYPREVEEVLYRHPAVRECAVVGVPDPLLGEEVIALVVAREGNDADPTELQSYVRERIAAYKYPRRIVVVDDLPHGPSGKVLRREIDLAALRVDLDQTKGA